MEYQGLFTWLLKAFEGLTAFGQWLTTDLFSWGGLTINPLIIFSIGGFAVMIALHIMHLVNPIG